MANVTNTPDGSNALWQRWPPLFALGLSVLILVFVIIQLCRSAPPICNEVLLRKVDVVVNGSAVAIDQPIKVGPGDTVAALAEIDTEPQGCTDTILVEWSAPFASSTHKLRVVSEAIHESLKITLINTQIPPDYPEQTIRTTLSVSPTQAKMLFQILTFEVIGEQP